MRVQTSELELAKEAARRAGAILKARADVRVDGDAGKDIKLSLDRESERCILETLQESSGFSILTEERGLLPGDKGTDLRWIVDPLDGTANYWRGLDSLSCVSVALWGGDRPILGVVYRFAAEEMYEGIVGKGAWKNGKPIRTSGIKEVTKAFLVTGFPVHRDYSEESLAGFIRRVQRFKKVRMLGSAALMGCLVAEGRMDAYMEDRIMLWDIAASAALVEAAGGCSEIHRMEDNQCICRLFASEALKENCHADGV